MKRATTLALTGALALGLTTVSATAANASCFDRGGSAMACKTGANVSGWDVGRAVYNTADDWCGEESIACSAAWGVAGWLVSLSTAGATS